MSKYVMNSPMGRVGREGRGRGREGRGEGEGGGGGGGGDNNIKET